MPRRVYLRPELGQPAAEGLPTHTCTHYSHTHYVYQVIMKIRAPLRTLRREAIRIRYPLLLHKETLREQLQVGRMATHRWGPIEIIDEFKQVHKPPKLFKL